MLINQVAELRIIKFKSIDYVDKDYYNWDDIITRINDTLSAFGKEA